MRIYVRMRSQNHPPDYASGESCINYPAWRQRELEKMTPDALLELSASDYHCWHPFFSDLRCRHLESFPIFCSSNSGLLSALAPQASLGNLEVLLPRIFRHLGLRTVFDAFSQRYCHGIAHFYALRKAWRLDLAFRRYFQILV
ncbi:hypothetical protein B296_00003216 [Ensete ventricosum]|uniref:Uncharacterized protein n=1 Tax=Ensete ventricosum TaxID=4639 RepID=A0A427AA76_ENSVE|nr:hypothetical protein B296_00003216 [Ensete ventricosum]